MTGPSAERVRAIVVGCSGYTGRELVRVLTSHPRVDIAGLLASDRTAAECGGDYGRVFPELRGICHVPVTGTSLDAARDLHPDVVFLATPHELSAELAWPLVQAGMVVIDLSGGHRLNAADYPLHYGFEHPHPEALRVAVYGLPELSREGLATSELIAVAGCYPTSALIPLAAVDRAGLLDDAFAPAITAISGVSGAGRVPRPHTAFCEVSASPYGVLSHRHQPEIAKGLARDVGFAPVLGPWDRGIVCTVHASIRAGVTEDDVRSSLVTSVGEEPLVRLLPQGEWPTVNAVRGSSFIDVAWAVDVGLRRVVLCSAIDNLLKGASGQAVQCMNIRFGMSETAGLVSGSGSVPMPGVGVGGAVS
jgi:N-acetyl-gamma-glutamyl-phosphate reductase